MTVYMLLETGYYHNDFLGAYSSEGEACKALVNCDYPDSITIKAVELDSNTSVPLSEKAKAFIDWFENTIFETPAYRSCSSSELQAIARAVFAEFFA